MCSSSWKYVRNKRKPDENEKSQDKISLWIPCDVVGLHTVNYNHKSCVLFTAVGPNESASRDTSRVAAAKLVGSTRTHAFGCLALAVAFWPTRRSPCEVAKIETAVARARSAGDEQLGQGWHRLIRRCRRAKSVQVRPRPHANRAAVARWTGPPAVKWRHHITACRCPPVRPDAARDISPLSSTRTKLGTHFAATRR